MLLSTGLHNYPSHCFRFISLIESGHELPAASGLTARTLQILYGL
jgi:hypothetical protein